MQLFKNKYSILFLILFATINSYAGRPYEGPDDPAGDRAAIRGANMSGNRFLAYFENTSQIGNYPILDGTKWPKDAQSGLALFDKTSILVGAQVFVENDSIPVTDEVEIATRTDLDTLWYIQTGYEHGNMSDYNPDGDIVWGLLYPVYGYFNDYTDKPAVSNDSTTWPILGWPSRGNETKWAGEWNGRFGRGVKYAQMETYFVANDAQDQEYLQADSPVKYYPRPGVKIGDKNPNVTIQRGMPWGGVGTRIEARGYQWDNPQTRDVIFWEYNIANISDYDIPSVVFGYWMDLGVGHYAISSDGEDDVGAFSDEYDMSYCWDTNGLGVANYKVGTVGLAFLESPGIPDDQEDNDDDGLVDEKRDNLALTKIGPYDGISDLPKFLNWYGLKESDLKEHWDADEDQDWNDGYDLNNNGRYDSGEDPGDDVGTDGVGPDDLNYTGPDANGTECNHKPDYIEGLGAEPNFAATDISESDMLGLTSFNLFRHPGLDQVPPAWKYDRECFELFASDTLVNFYGTPTNLNQAFGTGTFRLEKGLTERISVALVASQEDEVALNNDILPYSLLEKKRVIQTIYESDYRFAQPPKTPTLKATAGNGKVVLTWDDVADKLSREPLLGGANDFEGYKLYKATDRYFEDAEQLRDGQGNPAGKKPIFQCDLKNDIYGYADYAIIEGQSFFLGQNTGLRHYYVDENVENGRTYYYFLAAYDRGIKDKNIAPSENVAIIDVDENEDIRYMSPNVVMVTPHQPAANYTSPSLEMLTNTDDIAGTSPISLEIFSESQVKPNNEYKLIFDVDTLSQYGSKNYYHPMGYRFANTGFKICDVTDSNRVIYEENPTHFTKENILYDLLADEWYLNPDKPITTDSFDGIQLELDYKDGKAVFDSLGSGWITGSAPITVTMNSRTGLYFPWKYDIVFPGHQNTYTSKVASNKNIKMGDGSSVSKSDILYNLEFPFYVENKFSIDSTGSYEKLDLVGIDMNGNGTFEILEDEILAGHIVVYKDAWTWNSTLFGMNFTQLSSEDDLPEKGDVYRINFKRPFYANDEIHFKVKGTEQNTNQDFEGELDKVKVVPNPYVVTNLLEPAVRNNALNQRRRLMFTHVPANCEIKIFTTSGYLVDTIEIDNEPDFGIAYWDLLTKEDLEIAAGMYFYHIKSNDSGQEKMGKFAVIK